MEEVEPVEKANEDIHEHAHHAKERWVLGVALTASILAALAAVAASISGHHESECMLDQIKASDTWSEFQSKGIKMNVAIAENEIFKAMDKAPPHPSEPDRYTKDKVPLGTKAEKLQARSEAHMSIHEIFSNAVTFSQVAIAISAVSVLTKKRRFWFVSLAFGVVAICFLGYGFSKTSKMKSDFPEEKPAAEARVQDPAETFNFA